MNEHRPGLACFSHFTLWICLAVVLLPLYMALVAASLDSQQITQIPLPLLPSTHLWENIYFVWVHGISSSNPPLATLLFNSLLMALGITFGKLIISLLSAFALVWFRFPGRQFFFWLIFMTLMLPVEIRIFPTVEVVSQLKMLNSYSGLILPMMASATATFLLRQFFMSLPNELVEAARIDGASPLRFFFDIALPLTRTTLAALFVITFIYGWNQYLWPLLITTNPNITTAVAGIRSMLGNGDSITPWNLVMAAALVTLLPPLGVVLIMQRWFVKGLVECEK